MQNDPAQSLWPLSGEYGDPLIQNPNIRLLSTAFANPTMSPDEVAASLDDVKAKFVERTVVTLSVVSVSVVCGIYGASAQSFRRVVAKIPRGIHSRGKYYL
jgi:hypothetical protein